MALGSNEVVPTAAYITLTDKTDNKVIFDGTNEKAATERWFENLDYTHTYTLKVENRFTAAKEVELNFEGIENDIEVVFTSTGHRCGRRQRCQSRGWCEILQPGRCGKHRAFHWRKHS